MLPAYPSVPNSTGFAGTPIAPAFGNATVVPPTQGYSTYPFSKWFMVQDEDIANSNDEETHIKHYFIYQI